MKAWLNGKLVDQEGVLVSPLSQSFSRGTALFEVLEVVGSHRGPAIFGLSEHIARLFNSARLTFMELPANITPDALSLAARETALANDITSGILKIFAYYPVPEYACIPTDRTVDIAIFCANSQSLGTGGRAEKLLADSCVSSYRKIHPESVPVHAKAAGNYVNSFLALAEAKQRGCDEAILLDTMGFVAEGGTSNIFMVKNGQVATPTLRSILPGITRMFILDILKGSLACRETDITADELKSADEAFFSNSVERVLPVRSIDGRVLGASCPGPVTERIMAEIASVIEGRNVAFERWLTPL